MIFAISKSVLDLKYCYSFKHVHATDLSTFVILIFFLIQFKIFWP